MRLGPLIVYYRGCCASGSAWTLDSFGIGNPKRIRHHFQHSHELSQFIYAVAIIIRQITKRHKAGGMIYGRDESRYPLKF